MSQQGEPCKPIPSRNGVRDDKGAEMTCKANAARRSNSFLLLSRGEILDAPARFVEAAVRTKTKRPPAMSAGGLENPAATYSPGPGGQVPSAI